MPKVFNVTGLCVPEQNYMVDLTDRVHLIISEYICKNKYFTINRARQYGKTTLLYCLEKELKEDYIVVSLSFEAADEYFQSAYTLAEGLTLDIADCLRLQGVSEDIIEAWCRPVSERFPMRDLGKKITELCRSCEKGIILMIDEVDKSSDNQIFLSFLGLLRAKYLDQLKKKDETFLSVILAGVYDIRNLKLKLHPHQEPKYNSPWNIAADFRLDMNFSRQEIASMLTEYENDRCTGMDISHISHLIYEYTSGYPYLVSKICQLTEEQITGTKLFPDRKRAWSREGISAAEMLLRKESNSLFDDLVKKLADYPELKRMLREMLFSGSLFPFDRDNHLTQLGATLGFLKEEKGYIVIQNRIFETRLYDFFLSEEALNNAVYRQALTERNQFVDEGVLNMKLVMEKFCQHFTEVYGDNDARFVEEEGRKLFLLYLKPIINGTGNYYIEAQTRNLKRTDIIVDYLGQQYIIELKIWHGEEYNRKGEIQLSDYLEIYGLSTGYLLSFSFNKKKQTGMREIVLDGKRIFEMVV